MKTNSKIIRFFGVFILTSVLLAMTACVDEKKEKENPIPTKVSTILEQRNAFWKKWIDKCMPNKDWSTATFTTNGVDYTVFKTNAPETWQAMVEMYSDSVAANNYLPDVIKSGSNYPIEVYANAGQKLYKIVAQGGNIKSPSPYYVSETQLKWIKQHPAELEQKLGLPLSSVSGEYWIFSITSVADSNLFFQSSVAPTDQYANVSPSVIYKTPGGATQSLLINNGDMLKWKKSDTPEEKFIPDTLPKIEQ